MVKEECLILKLENLLAIVCTLSVKTFQTPQSKKLAEIKVIISFEIKINIEESRLHGL